MRRAPRALWCLVVVRGVVSPVCTGHRDVRLRNFGSDFGRRLADRSKVRGDGTRTHTRAPVSARTLTRAPASARTRTSGRKHTHERAHARARARIGMRRRCTRTRTKGRTCSRSCGEREGERGRARENISTHTQTQVRHDVCRHVRHSRRRADPRQLWQPGAVPPRAPPRRGDLLAAFTQLPGREA